MSEAVNQQPASPLEQAIARALEEAAAEQQRYCVIERADNSYQTVPVAQYKQLQLTETVMAVAMPDGEIRRL